MSTVKEKHISVQLSNPILDNRNGAKTVKNPPESNNWAKSCFEVNIGSVLEIFFGSANLNNNNPEATTPVELPNSTKTFSNQYSSNTKYAKKLIQIIFQNKPKIVSNNIGAKLPIIVERFKLAIAVKINRSVDNMPISLCRI